MLHHNDALISSDERVFGERQRDTNIWMRRLIRRSREYSRSGYWPTYPVQCLLQFGNLCALQSPRRTADSVPRNNISLSYISISELSGTYELTVVLRPEGTFDLRQFHHAVRAMPSSLSENIKPDGFEFFKQVSSLSTLLEGEDGLLSWTCKNDVHKVIVISSCFLEPVTSFRQFLLEAAEHFVTFEFVEIEQPAHTNGRVANVKPSNQVCEADLQMIREFANQISHFENCTLHRVPFDPWSLMRLLKHWHQDLVFAGDGPVEAVLLFPVALSAATNKLFCSFQPAIMQLADVFKPCKICTCHGRPVEAPDALSKSKEMQAEICGVTKKKLVTEALSDNGIMVGSGVVLSMPSFKIPPVSATGSFGQPYSIAFDVIRCVPLDTLSEGLLFGIPYIVSPSSEVDHVVEVAFQNNIQANELIFSALLQDLNARDCGLLCTSTRNIETRDDSAFLCFYILLPGQNGSFSAKGLRDRIWLRIKQTSQIISRLAGAEEMMVPPELARAPVDEEVSDQIKSAVSAGLSKLGTEAYNPLKNLRGCHLKLTGLVKESLQPLRLDQTEKIASARLLNPGSSKLEEEERCISDYGFDSDGRSLEKPNPPPNFVISATKMPLLTQSTNQILIPPLTSKRARNRFEVQKRTDSSKSVPWAPKGRIKSHQGLCYPCLTKKPLTSQQPDPYAFFSEPAPSTELPLLPSKRFPSFKTARQHLLDLSTTK